MFLADTGGAAVVAAAARASSSTSARIATTRPSSGGASRRKQPELQREPTRARIGRPSGISPPALRRDDARARCALRRRRQAAEAAAEMLVHDRARRARAGGHRARRRGRARRSVPLAAAAASAARREAEAEAAATDAGGEPPAWLQPSRRRRRPWPPQPLRPSRGLAEPDPLPAALPSERRAATPGDAALLRGRIVHLLLQFLPGVPADRARAPRAERLLAGEFDADLGACARSLRARRRRCSPHPDAEDALRRRKPRRGGDRRRASRRRAATIAVSGRIDRLVRDRAGWHLVDFKTDRAVPASVGRGRCRLRPAARALPTAADGRWSRASPVGATLVFTAGPNVMPIPAEMMEQALAKLGIRANPVP